MRERFGGDRRILARAGAGVDRSPGVIWWNGATVGLHEHRLDPLLAEAEARVRISPPAESVAVRTMYKKVGIDPTKTRPSNEALLRRVRKGDTIPRINSAVDVVNWCSLEFPVALRSLRFFESVRTREDAPWRRRREVRGHQKRRSECRRQDHGCRRHRRLRQSNVGFRRARW
jgi:hypothetical protein